MSATLRSYESAFLTELSHHHPLLAQLGTCKAIHPRIDLFSEVCSILGEMQSSSIQPVTVTGGSGVGRPPSQPTPSPPWTATNRPCGTKLPIPGPNWRLAERSIWKRTLVWIRRRNPLDRPIRSHPRQHRSIRLRSQAHRLPQFTLLKLARCDDDIIKKLSRWSIITTPIHSDTNW
jgi:hypothetical protein